MLLAIPGTAEDLHGLVGGLEARLVAHQLRKRGVLRRRQAPVGLDRGPVQQQLRGLEGQKRVRELPLQSLELAERLAELAARQRVLAGRLEGELAERPRPSRVAQPLRVEACDLLLEAAGPEQDVLRIDADLVEIERTPLLAVHIAAGLTECEAVLAALQQHRTDPVHARPEADINQEQVGFGRMAGEHLAAGDPPAVAVGLGPGGQVCHGGAGVGFRHAEADDRLALEQGRQIACLLVRRRVLGQGADGAEVALLDGVRGARVDQGYLLDGDDGIHQRAALAAVFLG